ncbi:hypothetical protein CGRA01v4_08302 [Colletotrichum graminicola]|nr:hypothetical protein CGRA01v4_08302 [Colletotrichum graminicola]
MPLPSSRQVWTPRVDHRQKKSQRAMSLLGVSELGHGIGDVILSDTDPRFGHRCTQSPATS